MEKYKKYISSNVFGEVKNLTNLPTTIGMIVRNFVNTDHIVRIFKSKIFVKQLFPR